MYIQHEIRLDPRMNKRVLRLHPKYTGNPLGKKKNSAILETLWAMDGIGNHLGRGQVFPRRKLTISWRIVQRPFSIKYLYNSVGMVFIK
jgi:hypothetical protein